MKTVITNIPRPGRGKNVDISTNWVTGSMAVARKIYDMIFCPMRNKFIALGPTAVVSSSDGTSWSAAKNTGFAAGYRIVQNYSGSWMILQGAPGIFYGWTTNSGTTISGISPGGTNNVYHGVAYSAQQGKWYLGSYTGGVVLSGSDPSLGGQANWPSQSCPTVLSIELVATENNNSLAMTIGGDTYMRYSGSDTWTRLWMPSLAGAGTRYYIEKLNNIWVMGTSNGVYTSIDLVNWQQGSGSAGTIVKKVAYGDGKFIAPVYSSSICLTSRDGLVWSQSTLPTNKLWTTCAYGNGVFMIMGEDLDTTFVSGSVV